MTAYTLFGNLHSGHSYKARLALLMLGLEHAYRPVDIALPREARDPEWAHPQIWCKLGDSRANRERA